ncbi:MAG TPA: hypothetical protein VK540_07955 [Polyangiaceae bacterium]|nr:hypothetical protein [Polyangiaceae bacterium]
MAKRPDEPPRKLLGGKSMFFYEGFGTIGLPKPLMTWLRQGHSYG